MFDRIFSRLVDLEDIHKDVQWDVQSSHRSRDLARRSLRCSCVAPWLAWCWNLNKKFKLNYEHNLVEILYFT